MNKIKNWLIKNYLIIAISVELKFIAFKKWLANRINKYQYNRLKRTTKSRQQLRDQKVIVKGKKLLVMDYIDKEARRIPEMFQPDGTPIDHVYRARQWYYKFDFKGVQYYFKSLRRVIWYMRVSNQ